MVQETQEQIEGRPSEKLGMREIKMKRGYRGIVALNCPSYMAGLRHVWKTKKIGVSKSKN